MGCMDIAWYLLAGYLFFELLKRCKNISDLRRLYNIYWNSEDT